MGAAPDGRCGVGWALLRAALRPMMQQAIFLFPFQRSLVLAASTVAALGSMGSVVVAQQVPGSENPEQAQEVRATGGLRTFPDAPDRATQFDGAVAVDGQRVEDIATQEDLVRFAVPQDALVTGTIDAQNSAQLAPPRLDDTDPYAPVGIRHGPLTWFPALDLAVGYDSNIDEQSDAREVRTVRLAPELRVESDWSRHAWNGELRGSLTYVDDGRDLQGEGSAASDLRLDLADQTTLTLRGGYELTGETVSDRDTVAGADGTTYQNAFSAGAQVERAVGLVGATLGVNAERRLFGDTPLADGTSQSNDDRDRFDGELTLRLARATGPIVRPFVEGSASLRRFDRSVDRNGFERDSYGYGLRGGFILADDGPVSGEASLGFAGEQFEDDRLDDTLALTAAASLTWDVTALTSATLTVDTSLDPTTQFGAGVGVARSALLGISHDLRRNVELRAGAGLTDTQFSGIDGDTRVYTGTAGATWRLSPVAAVRIDASYEHEPETTGDINRFQIEAGVTLRR